MIAQPDRRWLFTVTILTGSFLLFLVQPMVARMALPRLGGAPNVWNSAMLVYQALLLAGYGYAHAIGRFAVRRQVLIHLGVLLLAALSLPISLAQIAPPTPGSEAWSVPWLFLLTVGPAFFAVSAQAPLVQRWYGAHPASGNPYPLYAASNLGSFAGLLAYPLLLEPALPISSQSWLWAAGYGVLVLLVGGLALARSGQPEHIEASTEPATRPGWRTIALWLVLSAVPSGLMLSTTTFLTTDIMAMPLLWVIPLGLYLLSFVFAFADWRAVTSFLILIAPIVLLVDGGVAMLTAGRADLVAGLASLVLLFVVATALHGRLYALRPPGSGLTLFYLVMSAGGVLGGLFAALLAPLLFDWSWEHPLLIVAAAALVPLEFWRPLLARRFRKAKSGHLALWLVLIAVLIGSYWLAQQDLLSAEQRPLQLVMFAGVIVLGLLLAARRWAFVAATVALLLALGGASQLATSMAGTRERSYFGIYSVEHDEVGDRVLMHGTTVHGLQHSDPGQRLDPTTYYGPQSGIGLVLNQAPALFGTEARIGIVGVGVGTLACYRRPGQAWMLFEIDPTVLHFSENGQFTFMRECAAGVPVVFGDARLTLERAPPATFDLLAIDAFSSDAIPQHLLTREALRIYINALSEDGVLMVHISNRYVALRPVLARLVEAEGLATALRDDRPDLAETSLYPSTWVAITRDPARLESLTRGGGWETLGEPEGAVWTDEYASILPHLIWSQFL